MATVRRWEISDQHRHPNQNMYPAIFHSWSSGNFLPLGFGLCSHSCLNPLAWQQPTSFNTGATPWRPEALLTSPSVVGVPSLLSTRKSPRKDWRWKRGFPGVWEWERAGREIGPTNILESFYAVQMLMPELVPLCFDPRDFHSVLSLPVTPVR